MIPVTECGDAFVIVVAGMPQCERAINGAGLVRQSAYSPASGVVHIFPGLDAPAEVRGHDDPGRLHVGAADCDARALLARGQRGSPFQIPRR